MPIEIHPFKTFTPKNMRYLILGSFTSKDAFSNPNYDWYYSNGRNQFWPLIEKVYNTNLPDKKTKMKLFTSLRIGIADMIYKCARTQDSSLDTVLKVKVLNPDIPKLLQKKLHSVFFSSRFVENLFKRNFANLIKEYPKTKLVYLPSPSPRYARISMKEKVRRYKKLLPKEIHL